jgi:hypothetical protein
MAYVTQDGSIIDHGGRERLRQGRLQRRSGCVSRIDIEEGELVANFDSREITCGFGELDELVLAYATTIHKSQGSEYPAVVIPLSTQCRSPSPHSEAAGSGNELVGI